MKKYDLIVLGSGAANIVQEEALKQGLKVAHIEKGKWGGTCLTRGCIPTKVMTTAVDKLIEAQEAQDIGLVLGSEGLSLDWDKISQRTWQKINDSEDVRAYFAQQENLDLYDGLGYFLEDKLIEVALHDGTKEVLTADKIVIGTGGRTNIPQIEGLEEVDYLTTESFFGPAFPKKPYKSLIVIGGGAIGVEFAHIFAGLGSKVEIVQRNVRLLPKEDEEASQLLLESFEKRGIKVNFNVLSTKIREEGGQKVLTIQDRTSGQEREISAEAILIAPGIQTTTDLLRIQNTKIALDARGWIQTNEFLETSVDGIYALGDINGRQQFRHKANYEADILAHNLYMDKAPEDYRWARYDRIPAVTFCYPQVAHIGLTEKEALETGRKIQVGKNYYRDTAKGFALGLEGEESKVFAKVIIDSESKEILGIHAIGPEAAVLIQPFLNLMSAGETPHQTIHEEIGSALTQELRKKGLVRAMDPRLLTTVRESLVPHPSLSEVGIWTFYHLEDKN